MNIDMEYPFESGSMFREFRKSSTTTFGEYETMDKNKQVRQELRKLLKQSKLEFGMPPSTSIAKNRSNAANNKIIQQDLDRQLRELEIADREKSTIKSFECANTKPTSLTTATVALEKVIEKSGETWSGGIENNLSMYPEILNEAPNITISHQCPGIHINQMTMESHADVLSKEQMDSVQVALWLISISETDYLLRRNIDYVTSTIIDIFSNPPQALTLQDFFCHILIACSILLDRKCRTILPTISMYDLLHKIIHSVPRNLQSLIVVDEIVHRILLQFTHFHDRVYIAENLIRANYEPDLIDTEPAYFTTRLAKHLLYRTLCDLVGYRDRQSKVCECFEDIKNVIQAGDNRQSMSLYELYIMIKIISLLDPMVPTKPVDKHNEISAKNMIISSFALKNYTYGSQSDYHEIRALLDYLKVAWQEESDNNENHYNCLNMSDTSP